MNSADRDPRRGFDADPDVPFRRLVLVLFTAGACSRGLPTQIPISLIAVGSTHNASEGKSVDDSQGRTSQNSDRADTRENFTVLVTWGIKARGRSTFTHQSGYPANAALRRPCITRRPPLLDRLRQLDKFRGVPTEDTFSPAVFKARDTKPMGFEYQKERPHLKFFRGAINVNTLEAPAAEQALRLFTALDRLGPARSNFFGSEREFVKPLN